jgi:hypothetical protein
VVFSAYQFQGPENFDYGLYRLSQDGSMDTSYTRLDFDSRWTRTNTSKFSDFIPIEGKKFILSYGNQLYRVDSSGRIDTLLSSGVSNDLRDQNNLEISLATNNQLLIGGNFTTYNNRPVAYMAKIFLGGTITNVNPNPSQLGKITLLPNPASTTVQVESNLIGNARLYNAQGQVVRALLKPSGGPVYLDLNGLPKGLYILRLGQEQVRFVKE